jgi:hypothetical protein
MRRSRFIALAVATIAIGLAVYLRGDILGATVRDITGDALWATMIAWLIGAASPDAPLMKRGLAAYGICVGVELSQLIRAPWLDDLRATTLGHLALGSGFDPRDLAAYAAGVAAAVLIERAMADRQER